MSEAIEKARSLLGKETFVWFLTKNIALGGRYPIDCDPRDVIDVINRIEHGITQ